VRAGAVIVGLVMLAITGYWTYVYFRRRWRG
jgi:hypothetical protein